MDAHYHSFYHCTLLLKGDLAYFQQDQMLRMQPGDLLFTPIYCNHSLYIFPPETSYFCLSFSQEMMDALVSCFPKLKKDFSNLPPIIHMPRHERERLVHLLYCLMDEQNTSADSPFQIGNMLVISALQLMVRDVYTTQLLDRKQPSESNYSAVISCIRYIEQHLSDSIGTEDLVKVAALSQSSLYNAFKLHTGMPIRQYITERRIQQSLRLLRPVHHRRCRRRGLSGFFHLLPQFCQMHGRLPLRGGKAAEPRALQERLGDPRPSERLHRLHPLLRRLQAAGHLSGKHLSRGGSEQMHPLRRMHRHLHLRMYAGGSGAALPRPKAAGRGLIAKKLRGGPFSAELMFYCPLGKLNSQKSPSRPRFSSRKSPCSSQMQLRRSSRERAFCSRNAPSASPSGR